MKITTVRQIHHHFGIALALEMKEFLTFDARQAALVKAAGLKVKP